MSDDGLLNFGVKAVITATMEWLSSNMPNPFDSIRKKELGFDVSKYVDEKAVSTKFEALKSQLEKSMTEMEEHADRANDQIRIMGESGTTQGRLALANQLQLGATFCVTRILLMRMEMLELEVQTSRALINGLIDKTK